MSYNGQIVPQNYKTPPFPSLYQPINPTPGTSKYLYWISDIWRFTLYWTIITFGITHACVATWAVLMQMRAAVLQHRQYQTRKRTPESPTTTTRPRGRSRNDPSNPPTRTSTNEATQQARTRDDASTTSASNSTSSAPEPGASYPPILQLATPSPIFTTLKWVWLVPVLYLFVGGIEALFSGSIVGLVIGAVYNAGYFKMSTWTPFLWGVINCLIVILGSFRLQGGM